METFNEDSVVHEPSTETFYISFKSGAKAFINYKVEKNDTIDLWHTEVPDEGRGKGIGGFLASKSITGKSLSEALLFAEHGENMLCAKIVLNVRNNFCTHHVLPKFELGFFMY